MRVDLIYDTGQGSYLEAGQVEQGIAAGHIRDTARVASP
jgi:hypothetical protein